MVGISTLCGVFDVVDFLPDTIRYLTAKISTRRNFFESLILAQDERWRRALGMQIERTLGSQTVPV